MRVTKLLHTRMRVSNLDEAIRFYTTVLGLEVMERKTSPRGSQLAFLKVPNSDELIELTSFPPSGPVKVQEDLVHLAFEVESLNETIAALNAKGINVTDGPTHAPSGGRFIFIDAPDGYEIELIERTLIGQERTFSTCYVQSPPANVLRMVLSALEFLRGVLRTGQLFFIPNVSDDQETPAHIV